MSFLKKLFGGGEEKSDPLQKLGINLNEMIQKAQDASAVHVEIQTVTASDYMTMASAITGANREPRTTFVKKTTCHNCGGAKTLAPKTAYVYCDFCGSLTDYDFQKACENPQSAMPGPA